MGLWKTADNVIWDDMDGEAIGLPSWPEGLIPVTEQEADEIRNAAVEALPPSFPLLTSGEFQQGLVNMGVLTYAGILAAVKQAELPYPLKQIVDAAVAGGTPTAAQLQAAPYNLPAPLAAGVAQAIAGGLTLTAAERDKITFTWVTMVQVGRDYPIIGQLQLVLGISGEQMDQLFLTRGELTNG